MGTVNINRIVELCNEKDISITFLEDEIGIARGSIRRWDRFSPSIDKIVKVANYFRVSSDYILGLSGFRQSPEDEAKDEGLNAIKRARAKMSNPEKQQMDDLMAISFRRLFRRDRNDEG